MALELPGIPGTPERLRGQHCRIAYDIEQDTYRIKDLGIGLGTFLRCDNRYYKGPDFQPGKSVQLNDNCLLQVGTSMYALVNLISYA